MFLCIFECKLKKKGGVWLGGGCHGNITFQKTLREICYLFKDTRVVLPDT